MAKGKERMITAAQGPWVTCGGGVWARKVRVTAYLGFAVFVLTMCLQKVLVQRDSGCGCPGFLSICSLLLWQTGV